MNIREAVDILEHLYSSQDPIMYRGEDMTPEDLSYYLNEHLPASEVRISYYGGDDYHKWRHGTLSGMVNDRRRLMRDSKQKCPTCGNKL